MLLEQIVRFSIGHPLMVWGYEQYKEKENERMIYLHLQCFEIVCKYSSATPVSLKLHRGIGRHKDTCYKAVSI